MQKAAENLKKLLTSKDKKEMILEMASKNEIDPALMHLLQQNIDAAKDAEQMYECACHAQKYLSCGLLLLSLLMYPFLPRAMLNGGML
eukprot:scaffold4494_cov18-Tisochrysis_lutea.AAC.4